MTTEHAASRTIVKSPPELWAECSDAGSLARHIGGFGEIRITRLDPETSIAWEAEHAVGTVEIEPSGWGTRVTLTAQANPERVVEAQAGAPAVVPAAAHADEVPESDATALPPPADLPGTECEPLEEENDAKVEETVTKSGPALVVDPIPAGGRWKRLMKRTRSWFSPRAELEELPPAAPHGETVDIANGVTEPPDEPPDEPEAETPAPAVPPDPAEIAEGSPAFDPGAILAGALDSLGQAHHRPFSRS